MIEVNIMVGKENRSREETSSIIGPRQSLPCVISLLELYTKKTENYKGRKLVHRSVSEETEKHQHYFGQHRRRGWQKYPIYERPRKEAENCCCPTSDCISNKIVNYASNKGIEEIMTEKLRRP